MKYWITYFLFLSILIGGTFGYPFFLNFSINISFLYTSYKIERLEGVEIYDKYISVEGGSGMYCNFHYLLNGELSNKIKKDISGSFASKSYLRDKELYISTGKNCEYYYGKGTYYRNS